MSYILYFEHNIKVYLWENSRKFFKIKKTLTNSKTESINNNENVYQWTELSKSI